VVKRLLLALALLMSSTPAIAAGPALDGYTFERAEFEHRTVTLTFMPVATEAEMIRLADSFGVPLKGGTVKAFSIYSKDRCAIYAEDPRLEYEPEFIGHELAHCIFGNFHPTKTKELSK